MESSSSKQANSSPSRGSDEEGALKLGLNPTDFDLNDDFDDDDLDKVVEHEDD
jgi:hypothetical protein